MKKEISSRIIKFMVSAMLLIGIIGCGTFLFIPSENVILNNTYISGSDNCVPNQEFDYAPYISNDGLSDVIVFLEVHIPLVTTRKVANDGTFISDGLQELFIMKQKDDSITSHNIDKDWVMLSEGITPERNDEESTRILAYQKILKRKEQTPPAFEKIQSINFTDNDLQSAEHRLWINECYIKVQDAKKVVGAKNLGNNMSKETLLELYNYIKEKN